WTEEQGCNCEGGMPVMRAAETNMIEISAALSPRPQLIISVGNDPTQDFPRTGLPFIRRMYALAGAPDAVRSFHFAEEAHDFGPSKRREAYAFFAEYLGLEPRPEDRDGIVVEPSEAMEVFNDAHPLPPGAARGSAE